jgi:hypothetical protein
MVLGEELQLRKLVLIVAMLSVALAALSAPATAQLAGGPPPQDSVLQEDGTLVVGGDVVLDCPGFAEYVDQYGNAPSASPDVRAELEQARSALEQCEEAGFTYSPAGGNLGYEAPTSEAPSIERDGSVPAPTVGPAEKDPASASSVSVLPDTGGVPATSVLAAVGALTLVMGGLLARLTTARRKERS